MVEVGVGNALSDKSFGRVPREWMWGGRRDPCKAVCYRAGEGIGETEKADRKESGNCLPESRSGMVLVIPGRKCQDKSLEYCLVKSDVPISKDSGMFD